MQVATSDVADDAVQMVVAYTNRQRTCGSGTVRSYLPFGGDYTYARTSALCSRIL